MNNDYDTNFLFNYPNASHEIIGNKTFECDYLTHTKKDFRPYKTQERTTGHRRDLLTRYYRKKILEEIENENNETSLFEEGTSPKTVYQESFDHADFKPSLTTISERKELHLKYPLYTDQGYTINHTILQPGDKHRNILHPFRRNYFFSKPLSDKLDEPWGGF